MEDLLLLIMREAPGNKHARLREACKAAHDFLESQQGLLRDPPHDLRGKCFDALQLALETRSSKLVLLAVSGLQRIVRDNRFHSNIEPDDDLLWLPTQLLKAIGSFSSHTDDIQVDLLKVLLNLACMSYWAINGRIIIQILSLCCDSHIDGTQAVRAAAQAAASQTIRSFCNYLEEESQDMESPATCYNEVIPVAQYACSKLEELQSMGTGSKSSVHAVIYWLECLHTLFSSLPPRIHSNAHFNTFLWQKLCPLLISYLGSPRVDKNIVSGSKGEGEMGRGSACLGTAPKFNSAEAKSVYSIASQLVRLVGCVGSLRPVLESVFHRMLLYPQPQHRQEALKSMKELLGSPTRLLDLAGPILKEDDGGQPQSDLALLRLCMDSIVEGSQSHESSVCCASVACVFAMLTALDDLCSGKGMGDDYMNKINNVYQDLADCHYTGPLTYQSMVRLPKQYQERIRQEQQEWDSQDEDKGDGKGNEDQGENSCYASGEDSECSGDTEGPEDIAGLEEEDLNEEEKQKEDEEALRLEKVPKTLLGDDVKVCAVQDEYIDIERHHARHFVETLSGLLPSLLALRSSVATDEALQEFASKYCQGFYSNLSIDPEASSNSRNLSYITIINADGVYLSTYCALHLNLKLLQCGFYKGERLSVPVTEEQFVEEVLESGILVYLSATWLAEVYQQILNHNMLIEAGYDASATNNIALINLLIDIDGQGSVQQGGQLLTDYRRLERATTHVDTTPEIEAGHKFAFRVLTCCWESIVSVLSVLLKDGNSLGLPSTIGLLLGSEGAREEHRKAREAIVNSLEGLQKAARLSNILGLQNRCGVIFAQLAAASCLHEGSSGMVAKAQKKLQQLAKLKLLQKPVKLHTAQVLSMDVLLTRGLELGSHSSDCWRHVFKCCLYVVQLEHQIYSQGKNKNFLVKSQQPHSQSEKDSSLGVDDDDVGNFLPLPTNPTIQAVPIPELIQESNADVVSNGVLSAEYATKVVYSLSQQVDMLFDDAATKLNLQSLLNFLIELCASSQAQLFFQLSKKTATPSKTMQRWRKRLKVSIAVQEPSVTSTPMLLLHRVGDVMLKCVRSGRPLIHVMKVWSIVGPHLMEAACHKDHAISKKAISCIHDMMNALLNDQTELPHFHFNEALFKPFENLLCLELCDEVVQDQIVCAICEFVEGNKTEIRSGWRPLFGALRAVRIFPQNRSHPSNQTMEEEDQDPNQPNCHIRVLFDVFEAFLNTDNVLVFANAAVDCILCLLKHIRGQDEQQMDSTEDLETPELDMCLAALKYLQRCSTMLASMYHMPACPLFHAAHRIQLNKMPQVVDFVIPNMTILHFEHCEDLKGEHEEDGKPISKYQVTATTLPGMDNGSGILHVWYLLVEGMVSATTACPRKYQPHTMETLFFLLRNLLDVPGPDFGIFCLNHLLLPMLQNWLRGASRVTNGWKNCTANFKQCCGLTSDLVVDCLNRKADLSAKQMVGVTFMLEQLLQVMVECVVQPTEIVALLGCACIRHAIFSANSSLTEEMWCICIAALRRGARASLHPMRQLIVAFQCGSGSFYGDIGQVKVAARKDCTGQENERLRQLAHQVFLLDSQRPAIYECGAPQSPSKSPPPHCSQGPDGEERSLVFLLYPPGVERTLNPDFYIIRIPFRSLIVGLLAHQILLQTIGAILLQGSPYIVSSLANVLMVEPSAKSTALPGLLSLIHNPEHIQQLLDILEVSYRGAMHFDSRPGLKFLVQKVAGLEAAANLYKQAGAAWTIQAMAIFTLAVNEVRTRGEKDEGKGRVTYVKKLQGCFAAQCSLYADLVVDKDGRCSAADHMADQPLFFLLAQPDEFPEVQRTRRLSPPEVTPQELNPKDIQTEEDNSDLSLSPCPPPTENDQDAVVEYSDVDEYVEPELPPDLELSHMDRAPRPTDLDLDLNAGNGDTVYAVATQKDIDQMMADYRRRKMQFAMPSLQQQVRAGHRINPFMERGSDQDPDHVETVAPEIEHQQRKSIVKDSDAHMKVWTEMVVSVFDLAAQLDDQCFQAILPALFPGVRALTAHASHSGLKQVIAEFFQRVATLYGFSPE